MSLRWHRTDATLQPVPPAAVRPRPGDPAAVALHRTVGNRATGAALRDVAAGASAELPFRRNLEAAFGTDLGEVRVDLGSEHGRTALVAHRATAATLDANVIFDSPAPDVATVAHEVAHVLQQRRSAADRSGGGGDAEVDADRAACAVESGSPARIRATSAAGRLQFLSWHAGTAAPTISHDHGFLDDGSGHLNRSKTRPPTAADYASLAKWRAYLYGAQMLRPGLAEATRAYEHFLDGGGADLPVSYERFITVDPSGPVILASAVRDAVDGAREHDNAWLAANPSSPIGNHSFTIASDAFGVGGGSTDYPYPATENWQKAIGAHMAWISAVVDTTVDDAAGTRTMAIHLTLHMEDRYNFNPGAADIATGTKDAENGVFELTGLGNEFMQYGSVERDVRLTEPLFTAASGASPVVTGAPRPPGGSLRHDRAEEGS